MFVFFIKEIYDLISFKIDMRMEILKNEKINKTKIETSNLGFGIVLEHQEKQDSYKKIVNIEDLEYELEVKYNPSIVDRYQLGYRVANTNNDLYTLTGKGKKVVEDVYLELKVLVEQLLELGVDAHTLEIAGGPHRLSQEDYEYLDNFFKKSTEFLDKKYKFNDGLNTYFRKGDRILSRFNGFGGKIDPLTRAMINPKKELFGIYDDALNIKNLIKDIKIGSPKYYLCYHDLLVNILESISSQFQDEKIKNILRKIQNTDGSRSARNRIYGSVLKKFFTGDFSFDDKRNAFVLNMPKVKSQQQEVAKEEEVSV